MTYIAHIRGSDGVRQSVEEHLNGVKQLAERFGDKLGVSHIAGLAGLLHYLGKYSDEFQDYIVEAVSHPDSPPKRGSVDHTATVKIVFSMICIPNLILALKKGDLEQ